MREKRREERAVYIISVAAELGGVHPQTLRIYERKGLLRPARTAGNTRRYSERDIDRLRLIQELTQRHGINLAGVKMIMGLQAEVDRMRRQVEELSAEVARVRERLQRDPGPRSDLVPLRSVRIFPWLKDSG
ncbi:MAG TPA: helix-turn-helix transcriptional regulator [Actinomycetota bacterium]|nr:helix-turn-helix transcriptional regulator [Actinomycetota bacterium]